jgi:hypothetical protein
MKKGACGADGPAVRREGEPGPFRLTWYFSEVYQFRLGGCNTITFFLSHDAPGPRSVKSPARAVFSVSGASCEHSLSV